MWLGGISGHGAGGLISQWGSSIKLPWLCTVTSQYQRWWPWKLPGHITSTTNQHRVIPGWVSTCYRTQLWRQYSSALPRDQATSTTIPFSTQSHYSDTELTSPWPILVMLSARLGNDRYQFCKSLVWVGKDLTSRLYAWKSVLYQLSH